MARYSMEREREAARQRHEEKGTRPRGAPSSGRARGVEVMGIKVFPLAVALIAGYLIWREIR